MLVQFKPNHTFNADSLQRGICFANFTPRCKSLRRQAGSVLPVNLALCTSIMNLLLIVIAITFFVVLTYLLVVLKRRIANAQFAHAEKELEKIVRASANYRVMAPDEWFVWQDTTINGFMSEVRGWYQAGSAWNARFSYKIDHQNKTLYLWFSNGRFPLGKKEFHHFEHRDRNA